MDYTSLITSEYADKPNFVAIVDLVANAAADIAALADALPSYFDVDTAVGAQLDIVGEWVGASRVVPNVLTIGYFGLSELSTGLPDGAQLQFGEKGNPSIGGIFYELGAPVGSTSLLPDGVFRQLIYAKIALNQSDGTAADLVNFVQQVFQAPAFIFNDAGTLTIVVKVKDVVSQVAQAIVALYLPAPAGVAFGVSYISTMAANATITTSVTATLS